MTISRPALLPRWATDGGTRVEPNPGKKDTGYGAGIEPSAGEHNFLFGDLADWINYIDQGQAAARAFFGEEIDPTLTGLGDQAVVTWPLVGTTVDFAWIAGGGTSESKYSYDGVVWLTPTNDPVSAPVANKAAAYDETNTRYMVATGAGIEYTSDPIAGAWITRALPADFADAWAFDPVAGRSVVVSNNGNVYISTDLTGAFSTASSPPATAGALAVAYNPLTDTWVIIDGNGGVHFSTDDGDTWTAATTTINAKDVAFLAASYDGTGRFMLIARDLSATPDEVQLWSSTDGDTWTDISTKIGASRGTVDLSTSDQDMRLVPIGASTLAWLGGDAMARATAIPELMFSFDGGETWVNMVAPVGAISVPKGVAQLGGRFVLLHDQGNDAKVSLSAGA